jgi:hypothetical protein
MFEFVDRHPNLALWLIAAANVLAMLGVYALLDALLL